LDIIFGAILGTLIGYTTAYFHNRTAGKITSDDIQNKLTHDIQ